MPMLNAADVADLLDIFTDAQEPTSLTLYRYNQNSTQDDAITYDVQVTYPGQQPRHGGLIGTETTLAPVRFYREAPFDVYVGDMFNLDGHKGGTIRLVGTDPVLGVKFADGDFDAGTA